MCLGGRYNGPNPPVFSHYERRFGVARMFLRPTEFLMKPIRKLSIATALILASLTSSAIAADATIRVATYNTSLFREKDGQLIKDLQSGDNEQARKIAEVIQRVRPDLMLVNEFDYDDAHQAAELFRTKYLAVGQNGCEPIKFEYFFTGPVNTGRPSGRDLNHDGKRNGPDDAIGYGKHEGAYGMLVLSKFPIDSEHVRSFQKMLWRDMPGALLPIDPKTEKPFYDDEDLAVLRLSSKSHWDVPIHVSAADDRKPFLLHLLCSHPTPPVFDGPEDRNGHRNHDEVRLFADYIDPAKSDYLVDDAGRHGGLAAEEKFVIVGDLNCDPIDGEGMRGTMDQLLKSPRVNASFIPTSEGGPLVVKEHSDQFKKHHGDPTRVTADFTPEHHACLRIDYALPSREFEVVKGGIFWPIPGQPGSDAINATDHHSVWVDIRPASENR
jgi:endonuclease/exonuclease/phosphatase family metal-dependent hydrolase